jgi:hypothetical protein
MPPPAVAWKPRRTKTLPIAWPRTYTSAGRIIGRILASHLEKGVRADQTRLRYLLRPRSWLFTEMPEIRRSTITEAKELANDAAPNVSNGTAKAAEEAAS